MEEQNTNDLDIEIRKFSSYGGAANQSGLNSTNQTRNVNYSNMLNKFSNITKQN